jgi:ATP-dependent Clp protease adapter protein ClpS
MEGTSQSKNEVVQLKTAEAGSPEKPTYVVMLAANVFDLATLREFVGEMIEKVKMQRMMSPPTTTHLLVTVVGEGFTAATLKALWSETAANDQILAFFLSQMLVADIVHAGLSGAGSDQVSLLD